MTHLEFGVLVGVREPYALVGIERELEFVEEAVGTRDCLCRSVDSKQREQALTGRALLCVSFSWMQIVQGTKITFRGVDTGFKLSGHVIIGSIADAWSFTRHVFCYE